MGLSSFEIVRSDRSDVSLKADRSSQSHGSTPPSSVTAFLDVNGLQHPPQEALACSTSTREEIEVRDIEIPGIRVAHRGFRVEVSNEKKGVDRVETPESFDAAVNRIYRILEAQVGSDCQVVAGSPLSNNSGILSRIWRRIPILPQLYNSICRSETLEVVKTAPSGKETRLYDVTLSESLLSRQIAIMINHDLGGQAEAYAARHALERAGREDDKESDASTRDRAVDKPSNTSVEGRSRISETIAEAVEARREKLHSAKIETEKRADKNGLSRRVSCADIAAIEEMTKKFTRGIQSLHSSITNNPGFLEKLEPLSDGTLILLRERVEIPWPSHLDQAVKLRQASSCIGRLAATLGIDFLGWKAVASIAPLIISAMPPSLLILTVFSGFYGIGLMIYLSIRGVPLMLQKLGLFPDANDSRSAVLNKYIGTAAASQQAGSLGAAIRELVPGGCHWRVVGETGPYADRAYVTLTVSTPAVTEE